MPSLDIRKKGRDKSRRTEWPSDSPPITLGRTSTADIILHHTAISRHHCTFEPVGEHWRVRDHQSRHGVKINGVRRSEAVLADGDRIHIGPYELVFHAGSPADTVRGVTPDDRPCLPPQPENDDTGLEAHLSARDAEIEDLRDEFARIEAALVEARDEATAARAELQGAAASARGQNESERQQVADLAREQAAASRERIESLDEQLRSARAEAQSLRAQIESLEKSSAEAMADSRPGIERALEAAVADRKALEGELVSLRDEAAVALRDRDEANAGLAAARAVIEEESAAAQAIHEALAATVAERDTLQAAADEAAERFEALESARVSDAAAAAEWLRSRDAAAHALSQRDELIEAFRAQLDEALESAEDVRRRLAHADESLATLRTELSRSEELLLAEREGRAAALDETESRAMALSDLETRVQEMSAALAAAQADREDAIEQGRAELGAELAAILRERDDFRERLAEVTDERDAAMRQKAVLEQELSEREDAATPADPAEVAALRARLESLEIALAKSEHAALDEQQRLAVARQNIEQFRRAIADAQKDRDVWSSRARLAQAQAENLKKELAETRQRIHAYESLLVDYVTQLQATGQMDAAVVEMSSEEIRRAQREGATIVELDYPRR